MSTREIFYPELKFGGFTDIDGTVAFFSRINALLDPSFVVLDVGCGRGEYRDDEVLFRKKLRVIKGKVARVVGIDVDADARDNPFLDEFRLIEGGAWPVESRSINLIICDNVLEHVEEPDRFFSEVCRVLKHGGYLCVRTPNRWSYIALAARLVPNRCHARVTTIAQDGRKEEDVFPTVYRCNTIRKLGRTMEQCGFESVVYGYEAEPSYLSFSSIAFFLGVLHQRLAPGFLKPSLFAFGRFRTEVPSI